MEVTALKGSSGDVQHFADRIIAERGVALWPRKLFIPRIGRRMTGSDEAGSQSKTDARVYYITWFCYISLRQLRRSLARS